MAAWVEATTREVGQSLINPDKPSVSSSAIPEDSPKPALGPKPHLMPKPFSLQRNATVRPIKAPKTNFSRLNRAASSETLLTTSEETHPRGPKTPVSNGTVNGSNQSAAPESVPLSPKPDLNAESKPETTKSPVPTGPSVTNEDVKDVKPRSRAKSLGSQDQKSPRQKTQEEAGKTEAEVKVPSRCWPPRNRLSTELTSKFEVTSQAENETNKVEKERPPPSPSAVYESSPPVETGDEEFVGGSIKRRISLLFDRSAASQRRETFNKRDVTPAEISVDIKQRIQNLSLDAPRTRLPSTGAPISPLSERKPSTTDEPENEISSEKPAESTTEKMSVDKPSNITEIKNSAANMEKVEEEEDDEKHKENDIAMPVYRRVGISIDAETKKREEEEKLRQELLEKERQQRERERLLEEERKALEIERQRDEERKQEEERQRQMEERRKQEEERKRKLEEERREEERKRQVEEEKRKIEEEKERRREEERLRQEKLEKERKMEEERRRIQELERQKEEERLRKEQEMEKIRKEKEMEEERRRIQELERQKEEERLRKEQEMERIKKEKEEERRQIQELERQKEEERLRKEQEMERIRKEKEMEEERRRILELERQKEEERLRKEQEMERIRKEKETEERKLIEEERLRQEREKERLKKEKEMEEERKQIQELERQKEEERQRKEQEMERIRKEKEKEEERRRIQELERQKEEERLRKEQEMERIKKEKEEERRQIQELERQKEEQLRKEQEMEERKRIEEERSRQEREKERLQKEKEMEEERQRLQETERRKEEERLRQERETEMETREAAERLPAEVPTSFDLISFDAEEPPASPTLVSSVQAADVTPPLTEVLYDDFSVKPRRWGTRARCSSTPSPSRESPDHSLQPEPKSSSGSQEPSGDQVYVDDLIGFESESSGPQNSSYKDTESRKEPDIPKQEDLLEPESNEGELEDCEPEEDGVAEPDAENLIEETSEQSEINDTVVDGPGSRLNQALQRLTQVRRRKTSSDSDAPDVTVHEEPEPLPVLESSAPPLDSSVLRSKVDLGKKRSIKRTRPTRAVRQRAALPALTEGTNPEWRFCDSTDAKDQSSNGGGSESEEEPSPAPSHPKRVPLFPGMDPSALMAQLKRRSGVVEAESPTEAQAPPPVPARSPRTPTRSLGPRVLPPADAKDSGSGSSPAWLLELKSKKRMSQPESDA